MPAGSLESFVRPGSRGWLEPLSLSGSCCRQEEHCALRGALSSADRSPDRPRWEGGDAGALAENARAGPAAREEAVGREVSREGRGCGDLLWSVPVEAEWGRSFVASLNEPVSLHSCHTWQVMFSPT